MARAVGCARDTMQRLLITLKREIPEIYVDEMRTPGQPGGSKKKFYRWEM